MVGGFFMRKDSMGRNRSSNRDLHAHLCQGCDAAIVKDFLISREQWEA
jgi:hypothetical protein